MHEILVGWHVEDGYMWPYVLLSYPFANLIVATLRLRHHARTPPLHLP